MPDFGTITKVDLRTLWAHEALNFTPWLAENLTKLSEAIGVDLELVEQEGGVGCFSCDIVAREIGSDRIAVIENQLEITDHTHLGQLLTYASGRDAGVVVWISRELRDEHKQALIWLNNRTDQRTDIYAVVLEAFRIDDSKPAYKFNVVVAPNTYQKKSSEKTRGAMSSRDELYREFFQVAIDELREKYSFTNAKLAQPQNWVTFSAGASGLWYGFNFPMGGKVRVELYIDLWDKELNKAFFEAMLSHREAVETSIGEPLSWERLDNRRASRIALYRPGSITDSPEILANIRHWGVDRLLAFKKAISPLIDEVRIEAQAAKDSNGEQGSQPEAAQFGSKGENCSEV